MEQEQKRSPDLSPQGLRRVVIMDESAREAGKPVQPEKDGKEEPEKTQLQPARVEVEKAKLTPPTPEEQKKLQEENAKKINKALGETGKGADPGKALENALSDQFKHFAKSIDEAFKGELKGLGNLARSVMPGGAMLIGDRSNAQAAPAQSASDGQQQTRSTEL